MNGFSAVEEQWVSDGSGGIIEPQGEGLVKLTSASSGSPFSVRLNSAGRYRDGYFEVRFTEGSSFSVGMVAPHEMLGGWKTKGMFYNGNLTNGMSALKVSWGPRIKVDDSIGVRVTRQENHLTVSYYKGGTFLGVGFRLRDVPNDIEFLPCVQIQGQASFVYSCPESIPSGKQQSKSQGMFGDWALEQACRQNQVLLQIPARPEIWMNLSQSGDGDMKLAMKVSNPLSCQIKILENREEQLQVRIGGVMRGRMLPQPHLREIEEYLVQTLPFTDILEVQPSLLIFRGGRGETRFVRREKRREELTSY